MRDLQMTRDNSPLVEYRHQSASDDTLIKIKGVAPTNTGTLARIEEGLYI